MDRIRRIAWISTARGCGFGALAIFTAMIGFVTTPTVALTGGGFAFLLMAAILIVKAERAERTPHRRTEIWLMLQPEDRPPPETAPDIIARMRRRVFLEFARFSAIVAAWCLGLSAALRLLGIG